MLQTGACWACCPYPSPSTPSTTGAGTPSTGTTSTCSCWKSPTTGTVQYSAVQYSIVRFRMVKIWFPHNTFFSWFFTGRAFIMVYYIIKLVLAFQFDLQNPLKQPKMWIFEKFTFLAIFWGSGSQIIIPRHVLWYNGP